MRIYNTLTQKKEDFVPITPGQVGVYVCGVTVYDLSHIGHARTMVAFDVIVRWLRRLGYEVNYVRNFTDIDDKIIRRSNERGISTGELTTTYIRAFEEDMAALSVLPPTHSPRCTDYVPQMVEFVAGLVEKGYAYPSPSGDVYFRVSRFAPYGKLSKKNIDDLMAGARVEVSEQKESPLDFALWKAAKPGEPTWPSPWGDGRPGWHIECSVMSRHTIGSSLDIHGGGKDLIFPHHENEIAQSEAHSGQPLARTWMHNGFVNVPSGDNPEGTKMSKSLGNFYTIRDVLAGYHPQTVRFFMLTTHYRNDVLFSEEGLAQAQARVIYGYESIRKARALIGDAPASPSGGVPAGLDGVRTAFEESMNDDFNTPKAIGDLSDLFKTLNETADDPKTPKEEKIARLHPMLDFLAQAAGVLGVWDIEPAQFESELKRLELTRRGIDLTAVEALLAERAQARADKNWKRSDELRDQLLGMGIVVKDGKGGTTWGVI